MVDKYSTYEQHIADDAYELFNNLSFPDLIEKYYVLEAEIVARVVDTLTELFRRRRFHYDSASLTLSRGRLVFVIVVSFVPKERSLVIRIHSIADESPVPDRNVSIKLPQSFGLIQDVYLTIPEIRNFDYEALPRLIEKRLNLLYSSLEQAVLRASEDISRQYFTRLYHRIDHQLKATNKEHLLNNYYLVVAHGRAFHYFFDVPKAHALINRLKAKQHAPYSPFELMVHLLKTPLEFEHALSAESWRAKQTVSKEWHELTYSDSKLPYFLAEKIIYPASGHAARAICEASGYVLAVATASDRQRSLITEILKITNDIENIFRQGIKDYSVFFRVIERFKADFDPSNSGPLGRLLGAAAAEFIKTMAQS